MGVVEVSGTLQKLVEVGEMEVDRWKQLKINSGRKGKKTERDGLEGR